MIPAMIFQGKPNTEFNQKRIVFGSYAIVYIGMKNTMKFRNLPEISLSKSNKHGGNFIMNLCIGKMLYSYEWEELPIDNDVIK